MKKFEIPEYFKSGFINKIKEKRNLLDPRRKDFSPTRLNFDGVTIYLARHFGFCFGVQNAIEIAYKTIEQNKGGNIYLLSEMIHNPLVNKDLEERGLRFILNSRGEQLIEWGKIKKEDIVIIPAFGASLETVELLKNKGLAVERYETTCPFVEKVWNKAVLLGERGFTVVIHGKANHEETKATFSRAVIKAPSVVVRDIWETKTLAKIILGEIPPQKFYEIFKGKYSEGFDVGKHLSKIGVVNQTTMLAEETQAISALIKSTLELKYGKENLPEHFADTRDTLCYATNDNQNATAKLLESDADFGIVIGGYNSSNTTHLVELLEKKFKIFFISDDSKLLDNGGVLHFDVKTRKEVLTKNFLGKKPVKLAITSGASCPDSVVEKVIFKLLKVLNVDVSRIKFDEIFKTEKEFRQN